ncbi:unnamed protein product, partial [Amoebophrya sp. A120]|eukprot:GSA120T00007746001.1
MSMTSRQLQRYPLRDAVAREALCLDGSVPQYYYLQGNTTSQNSKVVLYFMHGGFCGRTLQECVELSMPYYSTISLPPTVDGYHLLSPFESEN